MRRTRFVAGAMLGLLIGHDLTIHVVRPLVRLHWREAWYRLRHGAHRTIVSNCYMEMEPGRDKPAISITRDATVIDGLRITALSDSSRSGIYNAAGLGPLGADTAPDPLT